MTRLIWVPDTQPKPEDDFGFLEWVGEYCAEKHPDYIVNAGDDADMPSLSVYDVGKVAAEGRRYSDDIEAANRAHEIRTAPIKREMRRLRRNKKKAWRPRCYQLIGNHENRITRAAEKDPKLHGTLTLDDLEYDDIWTVVPFLEILEVGGVLFSHYFASGNGKSLGGNAEYRLAKVGQSFVQGHQQTLMMCRRDFPGGAQRGLIAGACYLHSEPYLGPQGNDHYRGLVVLNELADGCWDQTEVSLRYLCQRYEGVDLDYYKEKKGII